MTTKKIQRIALPQSSMGNARRLTIFRYGTRANGKKAYIQAGLHADEPPILAGQDDGANPVEHLLNALAACVTTSMVAHAAVRGIHIEALESELEGDIDLRGFLGLDEDVPKGFTDIRVKFKVNSDVGNLERLKRLTAFSPVFNTITQGANVDIQVNAM